MNFRSLLSPVSRTRGRSLWVRVASVLLLGLVSLTLASCGQQLYKFPQYNFAGRPIPPSKLAQRVLVSLTINGSNGALQILDGLRDLRGNLQNTAPLFAIGGYSGGMPTTILNFPEQLRGIVYSNQNPYNLTLVNYGTESVTGSVGSYVLPVTSFDAAPTITRIYVAVASSGQIVLTDNSNGTAVSYGLNVPNATTVAVNRGDSVAMVLTRNSDAVYRIVKLNPNAALPPGYIDCQPLVVPVYCVVPVPGTFDRPVGVSYSVDGANAYVLNCGVECGGGSNGGAGVSLIPQGTLQINNVPTTLPYPAVVSARVSVPGGVTTALSDGANLYLAGQQQQPDGLFAGRLSVLNLTSLTVGTPVSISDGYHTKLLFADDNTLWIGSTACATGERAKLGQNYNCLSRYDLGAGTATVVPALTTGSVPYPNADGNQTYYGSLTGICWIQNYHKVYTAYGGQVHAFRTADGSEINNGLFTVQGTALDVAYMDALTNSAN